MNRKVRGLLDYFTMLALGLIGGRKSADKFGRNAAVGNIPTLISSGGIFGLPDVAQRVVASSLSLEDNPVGLGARTLEIFGNDIDSNEISEVMDSDGTSVNEYLRITRVKVVTTGTRTPNTGGNLGVITLTQEISGIPMIQIAQYAGQTLCACYHVPAGYTVLLWAADTTVGKGQETKNSLMVRDNTIADSAFQVKGERDNYQNSIGRMFKIPTRYPEKSDIVFTTVSQAQGTSVSATFSMELIKN